MVIYKWCYRFVMIYSYGFHTAKPVAIKFHYLLPVLAFSARRKLQTSYTDYIQDKGNTSVNVNTSLR